MSALRSIPESRFVPQSFSTINSLHQPPRGLAGHLVIADTGTCRECQGSSIICTGIPPPQWHCSGRHNPRRHFKSTDTALDWEPCRVGAVTWSATSARVQEGFGMEWKTVLWHWAGINRLPTAFLSINHLTNKHFDDRGGT